MVADAPLPNGLRNLLIHTRHATKGDPNDNRNNHPVTAPGVCLVHNGRVENDDELFRFVDAEDERVGEVDSEALAFLVSYGQMRLGLSIPDLLEKVRGVASIAWLDADSGNDLHLARLSTRPLAIAWTDAGDLVFASTEQHLRRVSWRYGVRLFDVRPLHEGDYMQVRNGEVVYRAEFKVPPRPIRTVPDDRPGASNGKRKGKRKTGGHSRRGGPLTEMLDKQFEDAYPGVWVGGRFYPDFG